METFKHLIWTRECITIWLHPFNESPDISEFGYFEYYPRIVTRHGLITNLTASLFMSRLLTTIMPLLSFTDASFTHHVSYRSLWNRNILLWVHIVNMVLPVNRVPHFIQWFTIMFPTFEWPCGVDNDSPFFRLRQLAYSIIIYQVVPRRGESVETKTWL